MVTIKPLFAWYDFWIGIFWDRKSHKLYILPLPCIGVVIHFGQSQKYETDRTIFAKNANCELYELRNMLGARGVGEKVDGSK